MFKFWHYRGVAYGLEKGSFNHHGVIRPKLSLYLHRNNQADQKVIFYGYDVSVAHGHELIAVYGRRDNVDTGHLVYYFNVNTQKGAWLSDGITQTCRHGKFVLLRLTEGIDRDVFRKEALDYILKNLGMNLSAV